MKSHILVVDDNPTNLRLLVEVITSENYDVTVAVNGESALEQVLQQPPDLILLDIMMPGIDGFETCRRLKEQPKFRDIPVIFMTALMDTRDKTKALTLGAVDYVTKPFQNDEILARIKVHLNLYHLTKELEKKVIERTSKLTQAIKALQTSQTLLQQVIDLNPNLIFVQNTLGKFTLANQAMADIFNTSVAQILGKSHRELGLLPDQCQRWDQDLKAVIQSQKIQVHDEDYFYHQRTGETRYFQTIKKPVKLQTNAEYSLLGVSTDITDRHRHEYERQKLASLVENSDDFIALMSIQQKMLFLNRAGQSWMGLDETIVKASYFADYFIESDRVRLRPLIAQVVLQEGQWQGELTLKRWHDDNQLHVLAHIFTIQPSNHREEITIATILRDITDRKDSEMQLKTNLEREKELNQLKSSFISMTSHEFRTPLTTILGSVELLKYYGDQCPKDKLEKYIQRITQSVQHLNELLDDVLLLSRAEAERQSFHPHPLAIEQFCRDFLEEIQVSDGHHHPVDFDIHCDPSLSEYQQVDEKLLRQVLTNLFTNAFKYSPPQSSVYFQAELGLHEGMFRIQDQGIGIPEEDQPHLFESFYRASNVGNVSGTGLGLAIVHQAVTLHGGWVTVASLPDQGTTFTFTIKY